MDGMLIGGGARFGRGGNIGFWVAIGIGGGAIIGAGVGNISGWIIAGALVGALVGAIVPKRRS